jgi:hypothetical protein
MRGGDARQRRIGKERGAGTAERRIRHHRHIVPLAPCQQIAFDAAIVETVGQLVHRAAIALRDAK